MTEGEGRKAESRNQKRGMSKEERARNKDKGARIKDQRATGRGLESGVRGQGKEINTGNCCLLDQLSF